MLCLQSPWPRVQYAAASALAMLAEGHPAVCESIMSHEGPQALAKMLRSNVGHARQAAAEAMQVGLGCLALPCLWDTQSLAAQPALL